MQIDLCLYQPDIAGNLGTSIRTVACLGMRRLHVIMPTAFPFDDTAIKRSMLDYSPDIEIIKHLDFDSFLLSIGHGKRLVLLTTQADLRYTDFTYAEDDILIAGSESRGVDEKVRNAVPHHVKIPMAQGKRSLNVAVSVGMALGEAARQLGFPGCIV